MPGKDVAAQVEAVKNADILVGIPSFNNARPSATSCARCRRASRNISPIKGRHRRLGRRLYGRHHGCRRRHRHRGLSAHPAPAPDRTHPHDGTPPTTASPGKEAPSIRSSRSPMPWTSRRARSWIPTSEASRRNGWNSSSSPSLTRGSTTSPLVPAPQVRRHHHQQHCLSPNARPLWRSESGSPSGGTSASREESRNIF